MFSKRIAWAAAWGRRCALLSLLTGATLRGAAQELVPGVAALPTAASTPQTPVSNEQYRRLRVRSVLVLRQTVDRDAPGRPLVREPVGYSEYDAQGRLSRWYEPAEDRPQLTLRYDLTYGPTGEVATAAVYDRLDEATDTTRLGRVWLPNTHTTYALLPGTGTSAGWDMDTGDWQLISAYRRWQSHDTTYQATTNVHTGRLAALSRTYYVGRGQRLRRYDELTYNDNGLSGATYSYQRLDKQRVLEVGRVDFKAVFRAQGLEANAAEAFGRPTRQQDELARRATGELLPLITQTFDAQGRLQKRTSALGTHISCQYNAQGQLTQSQYYRLEELAQLTHYAYLPSGLLARTSTLNKRNELRVEQFYQYGYFF